MKLTIIKNSNANYAKCIKSDGTKEVAATLSSGKYITRSVENLKEFDKVLDKYGQQYAIFLGIHEIKQGYISSEKNFQNMKNEHKGEHVTLWSGDNYPFQNTSIMLLDIDLDDGNNIHCKKPEDVIKVLEELDPQFKEAEILVRQGSSANIYKKEKDGFITTINGTGSYHVYVIFENVNTDLKQYIEALVNRAFILGYGYFKRDKGNKLLKRQFFDGVVFNPSRPIFKSGTVCEAPYYQEKKDSYHRSGGTIDCAKKPKVDIADAEYCIEKAKCKFLGKPMSNALF